MRFPSFHSIFRTIYTLSNTATLRFQQPLRGSPIHHRLTVLKSMPAGPLSFLGAFFGTSTPASAKMSYPDARSNDEWRAVLNKGKLKAATRVIGGECGYFRTVANILFSHQNNSASSEKKAPKHPSQANTTSTCPTQASTPAPPATLLSTKRTTSSSLDVDGPHTLIPSPEP